MSLITEFTVPAEAFALRRAFETVPDASIEIERLATHSREWIMPFFWATGDDMAAIERAIRDDPTVDELRVIDVDGDMGQFNVRWNEDVQDLVDQIVDQHGIVQEAEATRGTWYLKLKFLDQDALDQFQAYFDERGYAFELRRLYRERAAKEREYDLTTEQRVVLETALELGYFSVPREAQLADLADELGISPNAASERLRRATDNLTRNILTISPPEGVSGAG